MGMSQAFRPFRQLQGVSTTDFLAFSGYCTGLMLVYSNVASEPGLEVRIWEAATEGLPGCDNTIQLVANGILGNLSADILVQLVNYGNTCQ